MSQHSTAIRPGCSLPCTTTQGSVCTEDLGLSRLSRRAILLLSLGHGRGDMTLQLVFLLLGTSLGGMTAQVFRKNRKHFISLYQDLQNTVQMPIHVIHVVRNPYDNIATMLLYNEHQKFSVNETHKYEDEEGLDNQINSYFHQVRSVVEMIDELKLQVTEVHSKEFIANPKATLRRLCLTLHIDCSGEYLHTCAERTFASESRSRSLVKWTPSLIDKVYHNMQKYKHLQRYSFYS